MAVYWPSSLFACLWTETKSFCRKGSLKIDCTWASALQKYRDKGLIWELFAPTHGLLLKLSR